MATALLFLPLFSLFLLPLLPLSWVFLGALFLSGLELFLTVLSLSILNSQGGWGLSWLGSTSFFSGGLNIDGISIWFLLLTNLLFPICIGVGLSPRSIPHSRLSYLLLLFLIQSLLNAVFLVTDLLLFYLAFEAVLIPVFLLIGLWGSRERKLLAANSLFLYTLAGSLLFLLSILLLKSSSGCSDLPTLLSSPLSIGSERELLVFLGIFLAFSVKVPMLPVHL